MKVSEINAQCMVWIESAWKEAPLEDMTEFRTCAEGGLIQYHHTLGQDMRNENKLWAAKDVIGCPDEFSMKIIHQFWEQLNGL